MCGSSSKKLRLAIVVSHPIQYYVPLYQRLAKRPDLEVKVFYTWHAAEGAVEDHGFRQAVAWDIPLTEDYEYELVPSKAARPGTHHFLGLRNPGLSQRVLDWRPDAVHVTGWRWLSHLIVLRELHRRGVPTLFRGDSHLLDAPQTGLRWRLKRAVLERIYSWPKAFLYVGSANRAYYQALGVEDARLFHCPHSIEVARFSDESSEREHRALLWRRDLGIDDDRVVVLFAGKFEPKKRPLELMNAVRAAGNSRIMLLMVGAGELEREVKRIAASDVARFRTLPFQNQRIMPVVYRLGDLFVLPSAYGETWGLSVNEAIASARPVLASDRVGCAQDVIDPTCGAIFPWARLDLMMAKMNDLTVDRRALVRMRSAASRKAREFDVHATESGILDCLHEVAR